jgi:hypothetical protein
MKRACLLLLAVTAAACGPTVGDQCTTANDCLGQICWQGAAFPGGYCSQSCTVGDPTSCPSGTECVNNGPNANPKAACYRTCTMATECRASYVCRTQNGSAQAICVGPAGI